MAGFEKTRDVDEDIANIVAYSVDRWGVEQVRKYMSGLERRLDEFASGLTISKNLDDLIPGLRMVRYEHHYIFGLKRDPRPMLILAILHEKMDLMERLKGRLS